MKCPNLGERRVQQRLRQRLQRILKFAQKSGSLTKACPWTPWSVGVELVGKAAMTRLNFRYRRKRYPTDVLSFPAPDVFRRQGHLGELAICLPVLMAQAREQGHRAERELDILLVHGVLHLLGHDHERGSRQAAAMARWEGRLLRGLSARPSEGGNAGLIKRSRSGK